MKLSEVLQKKELNKEDLIFLLGLKKEEEKQQLYAAAYEMKKKWVGNVAYYRGLLELSNRCIKNCFYCFTCNFINFSCCNLFVYKKNY